MTISAAATAIAIHRASDNVFLARVVVTSWLTCWPRIRWEITAVMPSSRIVTP